MTRSARLAPMVLVALLAAGMACRRRGAAPGDCRVIFERLVELEMEELGYRDSLAASRWSS